jgi:hypothetical protein
MERAHCRTTSSLARVNLPESVLLTIHTAEDRPDLWERSVEPSSVWPEYQLHGDVLSRWWAYLDEEFADFQFVLYDEQDDTDGTGWGREESSTRRHPIFRAAEPWRR